MGKSFLLVTFLLFLISIDATIVRANEGEDKALDTKKNPASVVAPKDLKPVHALEDVKPIRILEEDEGEEDEGEEDGEGRKKKPAPSPKKDEGEEDGDGDGDEDEDEGHDKKNPTPKGPKPPKKDDGEEDDGEEDGDGDHDDDEDDNDKPNKPKKNPTPVPTPTYPKPTPTTPTPTPPTPTPTTPPTPTPTPTTPTPQTPTPTPPTPTTPTPPTPTPTPTTPPTPPTPTQPTPTPTPTTPTPTPPTPTPPAPPTPAPPTPTPAPPTPKPKPVEQDTTNYDVLTPDPATGCQRAYCKSNGACNHRVLTCPTECPDMKPKNKNQKGCFIHCGSKCEATCKWRRPDCNGYGALCYDPRFIGGDGVMFYFHGGKGRSFALVSDTNMQINALFIGNRPYGRSRDYTWVQSVAIMFEMHTLVVSAKKVAQWDNSIDVILVKWDGQEITVPYLGDAEWKTNTGVRQVSVERTDDTNSVRVIVGGMVEIDLKAVPVTKEDNKVHNYQLPSNDAFAHFETQFRFSNLSDEVEGILGKTYRPGYVSPAKRGVAMPIMGGEDKYETPSLTSTTCKVCMFQKKPATGAGVDGLADI